LNYFYKPVLITEWVNQEVKERKRFPFQTEKFKSLLLDLEIQAHKFLEESFTRFQNWINRLSPDHLLAFTFILSKINNANALQFIVQKIIAFSKKDSRVFHYALHSTYYSNKFDETWKIVKESYAEKKESITLGWSKDKTKLWDTIVADGRPISKQIHLYASSFEFETLIDYLMVEKGQKFRNQLLFDMFVNGTKALYKSYPNEFITYFRDADLSKRQLLAEGFIRSGSCYEVPEISDEIYRKMLTHVKDPSKWDDVNQNEKEEFHSWFMSKGLLDFFGDGREGGERFKYWKQYSRRINRLIYLPHESTILMYFRDAVIIEKLTGGAIYIYKRDWFDEKFDVKVSLYEQNYKPNNMTPGRYRIYRSLFMNTSLSHDEGRIMHYTGWQDRVTKYLRNKLGWDV